MNKTMRHISLILLIITSIFSQSHSQQPIKNLVILVMENRSFDHMIGCMKKSMNPSINGVTGNECNSPSSNPTLKICFPDDAHYVDPDPGHSFEAVSHQIFSSPASSFPTISGFVDQALSISPNLFSTIMKGLSPQTLPAGVEEEAVGLGGARDRNRSSRWKGVFSI